MSSADFVRRKLDWLLAVAADRRTRGIAHDVAILLACRYVNSESGKAWPSIGRLARDLDVHWSSVQRGLKQLTECGFLQPVGGAHRSNTYRLRYIAPTLGTPSHRRYTTPSADAMPTYSADAIRTRYETRYGTRDRESSYAADAASLSSPASYSLGKEGSPSNQGSPARFVPDKQTSSATASPGKPAGKRKPAGSHKLPGGSAFPQQWVCAAPELMCAHEIAGWDNERSYAEFDKFRNWCLRKNPRSWDWPASWRNWVQRGKDWDAAKGKTDKRPTTGLRGAVVGIQDWLDRRKSGME